MAGHIGERNFVTEAQIAELRKNRFPTKFKGCTQLYQYFIKADGTMACSCMRYWDILADMRTILQWSDDEVHPGKLRRGI
jgi:hypothetical protein